MIKIKADKENPLVKEMDHIYRTLGSLVDFVIAGGFPLKALMGEDSVNSSDIDLWFPDKENGDNANDMITLLGDNYLVASTENAKTYLCNQFTDSCSIINIQFIQRNYYQDIKAIINSFDFTVSGVAYYKGYFFLEEHTLEDIATKRLRLNVNFQIQPDSIGRITKYIKKGFTPDENITLRPDFRELARNTTKESIVYTGGY